MAQPSTIYKPGKLNYVWNYLGSTLKEFKAKLLGYRTYSALLTQTGATSDPTAVVLENTLGQDIVWTRQNTGIYVGTATGLFTNQDKVATYTSQTDNNFKGVTTLYRENANSVYSITYDYAGTPIDQVLSNSFVEIRIYL